MTFSVTLTPHGDKFTAAVLGSPEVAAEGPTRSDAVAALKAVIDRKYREGDLVLLEYPPLAVTDLAGKFSGAYAEALSEIVAEAYRLRDEEKAREFPE